MKITCRDVFKCILLKIFPQFILIYNTANVIIYVQNSQYHWQTILVHVTRNFENWYNTEFSLNSNENSYIRHGL